MIMPDIESVSDKYALQKKSCASSIMAVSVGIILLMVAGTACFYFMVSRATVAPVDKLAEALSTIMGTEVTVRGSTAVLEKSEIDELAVVQRKTQAIVKYETSWLGSKKILIVRGDFLLKAGFDFAEGGSWEILNGKINGKLPQGKVLSVEPIGDFEIYHSGNGAINRLNPQDHANAYNHLKKQARRDAERSDIGREAERVLMRRINDRMNGSEADLQWSIKTLP